MTFQAQKAEKKHVTVDAVILCAVLDLLDDVAVLAQDKDLHVVVLVLQNVISRLEVHLQVMRYLGSLAATSLSPAARRRVLLLPQAGAAGYLIK